MEINRKNITQIVNQTSIKPSKDYGQNFLIEPNISKNIVKELDIKKGDRILEIGPGLGSLTHFLALAKEKTSAIDVDQKMIDFLKIVYQEEKQLSLIQNDIRKENISHYNKIIGNVPYNITTELITFCLLNGEKAEKMVFMIQEEALNRFIDTSGEHYGAISVLVHLLGDIKKLFVVKAGNFYPVPKCHSVVFEICFDKNVDRNKAINVYKMSKILFANRRKTISNNLKTIIKNKEEINVLCQSLNINPLSRPEQLPPSIYQDIYEYVNK